MPIAAKSSNMSSTNARVLLAQIVWNVVDNTAWQQCAHIAMGAFAELLPVTRV